MQYEVKFIQIIMLFNNDACKYVSMIFFIQILFMLPTMAFKTVQLNSIMYVIFLEWEKWKRISKLTDIENSGFINYLNWATPLTISGPSFVNITAGHTS